MIGMLGKKVSKKPLLGTVAERLGTVAERIIRKNTSFGEGLGG